MSGALSREAVLAVGTQDLPIIMGITILAAVLEGFERRYSRLVQGRSPELLREWEDLSALPRGMTIAVEAATGRREGRLIGVDEEGALLLTAPDGRTERVPFGEIVDPLWS